MDKTFTAEDLAAMIAGHMSKQQLLELINALEESETDEAAKYSVKLLEKGFISWTGENIR